MNFKFNRWKIIASIVIPIIIWIIVFIIAFYSTSFTSFPTLLKEFLSIHNITNIFAAGNIFLFIIEVTIGYIIWSLFQNKK